MNNILDVPKDIYEKFRENLKEFNHLVSLMSSAVTIFDMPDPNSEEGKMFIHAIGVPGGVDNLLSGVSEASRWCLSTEEQLQIASKDDNHFAKISLIRRIDLYPEVFKILFVDPVLREHVIWKVRKENFKYQNPKTQELLEKALLLV